MDGEIIKAVQNVGVDVSKDELIKALQYDRGQYQKGYEDGKEDATTQWIPASEDLPDKGQWVIATSRSDIENEWEVPSIVQYMGNGIWRWNTPFNICDVVVAWMPLPKPYKGDDNE